MSNPFVYVLILSYNGKELLYESIPSYLSNNYSRFKVMVVDNGSTDHTEEFLKTNFPEVLCIRTEVNLGYSGGMNLGLEYAFKKEYVDYVLVSNNDVKADCNVIQELVKVALLDRMIGFVTGKVYYYSDPSRLQSVGKKFHPVRWNGGHIGNNEIDHGQYEIICERYFADDIFTLVSKHMFLETGGYDILFRFQGEEYDWQARAKKLGFKIFYTPHARIWHKESATIGKVSPIKLFYDARNPLLVIRRHKTFRFFVRFFFFHVLNSVLIPSLRMFYKGQRKEAAALWKGLGSASLFILFRVIREYEPIS